MGYPFWTMGGSPGGNHLFCTGCMFGATVCPWCLRGFSDRAVSPRLSERHAAMRTDRKLQHMRTPLNVNLQMKDMKGMTRDCTHDPNET